MTLYHIHRKYNQDALYKVGNTIKVDSRFKNNIYNQVNGFSGNVNLEEVFQKTPEMGEPDYKSLFTQYVKYKQEHGYPFFDKLNINLGDFALSILEISKRSGTTHNYSYLEVLKELKGFLKYLNKKGETVMVNKLNDDRFVQRIVDMAYQSEDSKRLNNEVTKLMTACGKMIINQDDILTELALEQYRLANCSFKPSRMNTMFAVPESSLPYWERILGVSDHGTVNGELFIVESDVDENKLFRANPLPDCSDKTFGERIKESSKYYSVDQRMVRPDTCEVLLEGNVTIKEHVKSYKH